MLEEKEREKRFLSEVGLREETKKKMIIGSIFTTKYRYKYTERLFGFFFPSFQEAQAEIEREVKWK